MPAGLVRAPPAQPGGASNQFARPPARPRSPRALTLPIMNIMAGLPVPVMSLRNSTGPITSERSAFSDAPSSTRQVPCSTTTAPDLSLQLGPAEFLKLITGTGNPAMMFMMGKVKAKGDLGLATALATWFETPKG